MPSYFKYVFDDGAAAGSVRAYDAAPDALPIFTTPVVPSPAFIPTPVIPLNVISLSFDQLKDFWPKKWDLPKMTYSLYLLIIQNWLKSFNALNC